MIDILQVRTDATSDSRLRKFLISERIAIKNEREDTQKKEMVESSID